MYFYVYKAFPFVYFEVYVFVPSLRLNYKGPHCAPAIHPDKLTFIISYFKYKF